MSAPFCSLPRRPLQPDATRSERCRRPRCMLRMQRFSSLLPMLTCGAHSQVRGRRRCGAPRVDARWHALFRVASKMMSTPASRGPGAAQRGGEQRLTVDCFILLPFWDVRSVSMPPLPSDNGRGQGRSRRMANQREPPGVVVARNGEQGTSACSSVGRVGQKVAGNSPNAHSANFCSQTFSINRTECFVPLSSSCRQKKMW